MAEINLFVYGTLREPHIQQLIMGRSIQGLPDQLEDHITEEVLINGRSYMIAKAAAGNK